MEMQLTNKNQKAWTLTDAEINWLKANRSKYTSQQLADKFHCTYSRMRHFLNKHKIIIQKHKAWTKKSVKFLKANYLVKGDTELGKILGRTKKSIRKKRVYLNLHRDMKSRKAIMVSNGKRTRSEQATPPNKVHNEGDIWWTNHGSGHWMIKINNKSIHWNRWAWEQKHGKIPAGYLIIYADGNKQNRCIENLQIRKRKCGHNQNKLRRYIKGIIWRQDKKSYEYWLTSGASFHKTPFGGVWVKPNNKAYDRLRETIAQFNQN